MELFFCPSKVRSRWLKILPLGLSLLLLAGSASAQTPGTFVVGSGYNGGGLADANNSGSCKNYTTLITATNFVNADSTFSYSLTPTLTTWLDSLYQGWRYTLNFTNQGEMDCTTGFRFDQQIGSHTEAANFYNSGGSIQCGTSTGAILLNQFFNTASGVYYTSYGGLYVWATNIVVNNSGVMAVGVNGLAKFTGSIINFDTAELSIASQSGLVSGSSSVNISATGQTDFNTNNWSPSATLGQFSASAPLNTLPYQIYLFNSVPYYKSNPDSTGTNVIVRMIFLQDNSVNVTTNIYIGGASDALGGHGTVEWVGTYTDPATGQAATNYLYLSDDYIQGSATNNLSYGDPGTGLPNNFTFVATTAPLFSQVPITAGYPTGILNSDNTTNNIYSYVNANLIATSISTNNGTTGSINLTNLPGRVEITAAKSMNFSQSSISGMNYLLLRSTNQFDYSQSSIASPYSDIYIGNTNNSMAVTNLINSSLPKWSGTVQAYSTRWTNTVGGINYDYRVMLVSSQLTPTSPSQVANLAVYSSNNVVISDVLNVFGSLYLNCTNLLLTANGVGNGAASLDGELNLNSTTMTWAGSVPRLRCLTNNGVIQTLNDTAFGSAALPYLDLVNSGFISNFGKTVINANEFENYGSISAASGSFSAQSVNTIMTNASVFATSAVALTNKNMVISGTIIQSGSSLTLTTTNQLTDNGVASGNIWIVGNNYAGFGNSIGLVLPIKPMAGDLLGTTIEDLAVIGTKTINNTWAATDYGAVNNGFVNNAAVGQLVLDSLTNSAKFYFAGTAGAGITNAIYVDCLQLTDYSTNIVDSGNNDGFKKVSNLSFSNNLVIYYAQALANGISVANKLNHGNSDHLRWVPSYAGYFSSTNMVYPTGVTNSVNAALAQDTTIDSDSDGIKNYLDPSPIFGSQQVNFTITMTNLPPKSARVQWATIPNGTNYIYYRTNLLTGTWLPFTNFNNYYYGPNLAKPNPTHVNWFPSPQTVTGPATNVWIFDPLTNTPHFYQVIVQTWLTYPY